MGGHGQQGQGCMHGRGMHAGARQGGTSAAAAAGGLTNGVGNIVGTVGEGHGAGRQHLQGTQGSRNIRQPPAVQAGSSTPGVHRSTPTPTPTPARAAPRPHLQVLEHLLSAGVEALGGVVHVLQLDVLLDVHVHVLQGTGRGRGGGGEQVKCGEQARCQPSPVWTRAGAQGEAVGQVGVHLCLPRRQAGWAAALTWEMPRTKKLRTRIR